MKDPLTCWTANHAVELYYISEKCFELHLLLVDGDEYENETYWYFTLRGTNIKFTEDIEKIMYYLFDIKNLNAII